VLYAEARLGELLSETVKPGNPQLSPRDDNCRLAEGVSLNMSSQYQKLVRHPDIIERIAARAREEDRIVTRKEVLREIDITERPNPSQSPPLLEGKYSVIYADPPWRYAIGTALPANAIENLGGLPTSPTRAQTLPRDVIPDRDHQSFGSEEHQVHPEPVIVKADGWDDGGGYTQLIQGNFILKLLLIAVDYAA
jgi:hypothetical protein